MRDYIKEIEGCELKILQLEETINRSKEKIKAQKQKIKRLAALQQKDEQKKIMQIISKSEIKTAAEFKKILDAAQSRQEENL